MIGFGSPSAAVVGAPVKAVIPLSWLLDDDGATFDSFKGRRGDFPIPPEPKRDPEGRWISRDVHDSSGKYLSTVRQWQVDSLPDTSPLNQLRLPEGCPDCELDPEAFVAFWAWTEVSPGMWFPADGRRDEKWEQVAVGVAVDNGLIRRSGGNRGKAVLVYNWRCTPGDSALPVGQAVREILRRLARDPEQVARVKATADAFREQQQTDADFLEWRKEKAEREAAQREAALQREAEASRLRELLGGAP